MRNTVELPYKMPLDACFTKIINDVYKHDCFILKLQCSYKTVL